ncbi:hypothetical protein [Achromobacter aloeverae]
MPVTRKLIRADGSETALVGPHALSDLRQMIGADTIDVVRLADRVHVMLVDDVGPDKGLADNEKATALYHQVCLPGTTHRIVGDVVIVPDSDFARFA